MADVDVSLLTGGSVTLSSPDQVIRTVTITAVEVVDAKGDRYLTNWTDAESLRAAIARKTTPAPTTLVPADASRSAEGDAPRDVSAAQSSDASARAQADGSAGRSVGDQPAGAPPPSDPPSSGG